MSNEQSVNPFLELKYAIDNALNISQQLYEWVYNLNDDGEKITRLLLPEEQKLVAQLFKEWQPHQNSQNHWLLSIRQFLSNSQFMRKTFFLVELQKLYGEALYLGHIDFNSCVDLLKMVQTFEENSTSFEEGVGNILSMALKTINEKHECFKKSEEILEVGDDTASSILEELATWEEDIEFLFKALKAKIFSVAVWWISKEGFDKGWRPGAVGTVNEILVAYNTPDRLQEKIGRIQGFGDVANELGFWELQFNTKYLAAHCIDEALGNKVARVQYLAQILEPSTRLNGGSCLGDTDYWLERCSVLTLAEHRKTTFTSFGDLHESTMNFNIRAAQIRQGITSVSVKFRDQEPEFGDIQYDREVERDETQYQNIAVLEGKSFTALLADVFSEIRELMEHQKENSLRLRVALLGESIGHRLGFFVDGKTRIIAFHDSNFGVFSATDLSELERVVKLSCLWGEYHNLFQKITLYGEAEVPRAPSPDKLARLKVKKYLIANVLLKDEIFEQVMQAHRELQAPTLADDFFWILLMIGHLLSLRYQKYKSQQVVDLYRDVFARTSLCLSKSREKGLTFMIIVSYSFGRFLVQHGNRDGYAEMQRAVDLCIEWMQDKPEMSDALKSIQTVNDRLDSEKVRWKHLDDILGDQATKLFGREFQEASEALTHLSSGNHFADSLAFLRALEKIEKGTKPVLHQHTLKPPAFNIEDLVEQTEAIAIPRTSI